MAICQICKITSQGHWSKGIILPQRFKTPLKLVNSVLDGLGLMFRIQWCSPWLMGLLAFSDFLSQFQIPKPGEIKRVPTVCHIRQSANSSTFDFRALNFNNSTPTSRITHRICNLIISDSKNCFRSNNNISSNRPAARMRDCTKILSMKMLWSDQLKA